MQTIYNNTSLTPLRVAKTTGFLDWNTQPSQFKHYPDFLYRYHFNEISQLKLAEMARCVTGFHNLQGKPYYRLNTPSAGNLHPLELYVQIRGIKGVISGIYHIDAKEETLVLITEIEEDGLETALGIENRFEGMLFILSMVPFRSEWKYGERSIRYCYLDAGHQLAAVLASSELMGQNCTVLSDIDRDTLDKWLGFSKQELSCIAIAVGKEKEKKALALKKPLIQVSPVDYIEGMQAVGTSLYKMTYPKYFKVKPFWESIEDTSILSRRSARYFMPKPLNSTDTAFFYESLESLPDCLDAYMVVLRSDTLSKGIYSVKKLIDEGDYHQLIPRLMVDQHFLANAAVVMIFTAKEYTPESLIQSGLFVHMLHLSAQSMGLGCTGIGAFYDKQVQNFLQTKNAIVYVCALGVVA